MTFGGVPVTSVTWISTNEITAVTPPYNTPIEDWVNITVTNPNGSSDEQDTRILLRRRDAARDTPTITGTLGSNGWYTSDVQVEWTVVDNESGDLGWKFARPSHRPSIPP